MRPRQRPPALLRVEREIHRWHVLDDDRPFHVAKLAPVQEAVLFDAFGPPQVDVTRGLHQPLAIDHALARLLEPTLRKVILEHRIGRLLDLKEERVGSLRPWSNTMKARVPTLPTPTTFRATSMTSKRSKRWRRSSEGAPVGAKLLVDQVSHLVG